MIGRPYSADLALKIISWWQFMDGNRATFIRNQRVNQLKTKILTFLSPLLANRDGPVRSCFNFCRPLGSFLGGERPILLLFALYYCWAIAQLPGHMRHYCTVQYVISKLEEYSSDYCSTSTNRMMSMVASHLCPGGPDFCSMGKVQY